MNSRRIRVENESLIVDRNFQALKMMQKHHHKSGKSNFMCFISSLPKPYDNFVRQEMYSSCDLWLLTGLIYELRTG